MDSAIRSRRQPRLEQSSAIADLAPHQAFLARTRILTVKHTAAGIYSRFTRILCKAPCFETIDPRGGRRGRRWQCVHARKKCSRCHARGSACRSRVDQPLGHGSGNPASRQVHARGHRQGALTQGATLKLQGLPFLHYPLRVRYGIRVMTELGRSGRHWSGMRGPWFPTGSGCRGLQLRLVYPLS